MTEIKVCGITSLTDAERCVELGVHALGFNFWPGSKRYCPPAQAAEIIAALPPGIQKVGVYVDASAEELRRISETTGADWVQLHGDEAPELLEAFLPKAYKAFRVAGPEILGEVERYAGDEVLLDAFVPGEAGGTGKVFPWPLAREVGNYRRVTLAGGLHAGNVAQAIFEARPYRVDVASGIEAAPGRKDPDKLRAFVAAVGRADAEHAEIDESSSQRR